MSAIAVAERPWLPALPGPYRRPPAPDALRPDPATMALVRGQVQALLLSSPSFYQLGSDERRAMAGNLVKIAAYAAECVRDDWYQSARLGQRPLIERSEPLATATADQRPGADFVPGAANRIGAVTRQTLGAIAFPTFVAELIRGTFEAITKASITQMEAYGRLLGDVGRTVDDFMNQNISDNQSRDWLVQSYPLYLKIERTGAAAPDAPRRSRARSRRTARAGSEPQARVVPVEGAEDRPLPDWRTELGVSGQPSLDGDWLESQLVPAARRKLAQTRLQLLSTLVLMGMNRITVTGGKLRATMAFHIDTSDSAHEERATDLDFRTAASGSFGLGAWSASASASFAYVTSTRNVADSEMNVAADLTSEVEIHFRSDPFPIERMATGSALGQIASHTAVPEANTPTSSSGETISWGPPVERATVPQRQRPAPTMRPAGAPLPAAPAPAEPAPVVRPKTDEPAEGKSQNDSKPKTDQEGSGG